MTQGEIRYDGRAILITGAGRGMGRTHALLLASRGAKVVVADNGSGLLGEAPSMGPAETVVAEIKAAGGEAVACTADLSTEDGSNQAVETALKVFGRIDGLLHNATTVPDFTTTDKLSSHDLEVVMRINTFAGLWMARAGWPHMVKQKYGRILYKTSGGIFGSPGAVGYCAAKGAVIGIVRCLAAEGAEHGIRINAVAPAARTRTTEGFLVSDYGKWFFNTMAPEKVSVGVAYLMSEACDINGEAFEMGGGRFGRITLGETEGVFGTGASIEEVRDLMPRIMADTKIFYAKDLAERSSRIAALFGFDWSAENRVVQL